MVFYIPDFHVTGIGFNALNKSREDLLLLYHEMNFQPLIEDIITVNDEKIKYFASNMDLLGGYVDSILKAIDQKCKENDYLLMDFPFAIKFQGYSKIVSYAVSKKVKVVFFVHDLDGIRFQNPLVNLSDSTCLDMAYCLITPSKQMDEVLHEQLRVSKKVRIVNHDFWDYHLKDTTINENRNALLCFAGNLKKSDFIKEIPDSLVSAGFNCYGKGFAEDYKGQFKGEYDPETLAHVLDGKFGLVWDGRSASSCSGSFGKYLRINTSHKFGLYLASAKPVIVWREGSICDFVQSHKIGFSVNSLYEIPEILSSIDIRVYNKMVENVLKIRKEVITMNHLRNVILSSFK